MTAPILSFSIYDLALAIKRNYKSILLCSLFFGIVAFVYCLMQPIHYTAKGIVKNKNITFSPLSFLEKSEGLNIRENPKEMLLSPPLLENVVKVLNLQLMILDSQNSSLFHRIFETLSTEIKLYLLAKKQPPSNVLSPKILSTDQLLIKEKSHPLKCHELHYDSEFSDVLSVFFEDQTHFVVFKKKKLIGSGQLDRPFFWEHGSFTLMSRDSIHPHSTYTLSLIPASLAAQSISKSLNVNKSKQNPSFFHLTYTHSDRGLAAAIINEAMHQFQVHQQELMVKQVAYLNQRKEELIKEHFETLSTYQKNLEMRFLKGVSGVDFEQALEQRVHLMDELSQIREKVHQLESADMISFEYTDPLIGNYLNQLDMLLFNQKSYEEALSYLKQKDQTIPLCTALVSTPVLEASWKKISELQHQLNDEKNWTLKEKELIKERIEAEKSFLFTQIEHLQLVSQIQEKNVRAHLLQLCQQSQKTFIEKAQKLEEALAQQEKAIAELADHWMDQTRFSFLSNNYLEFMKEFSLIIEDKKCSVVSDDISSAPFYFAQTPVLPDPPCLFLKFLYSSLTAAIASLVLISLFEIYISPRLNIKNLENLNHIVCGTYDYPWKKRTLRTLHTLKFYLSQRKAKTILFFSQEKQPFLSASIGSLFKKETILLIDCTEPQENFLDTLSHELENPFSPSFSIIKGCPLDLIDELLPLLPALESKYDKIILLAQSSLKNVAFLSLQKLTDSVVFCARNERIHDIVSFPSQTLFLFTPQIHPQLKPTFSQLMMHSNFS